MAEEKDYLYYCANKFHNTFAVYADKAMYKYKEAQPQTKDETVEEFERRCLIAHEKIVKRSGTCKESIETCMAQGHSWCEENRRKAYDWEKKKSNLGIMSLMNLQIEEELKTSPIALDFQDFIIQNAMDLLLMNRTCSYKSKKEDQRIIDAYCIFKLHQNFTYSFRLQDDFYFVDVRKKAPR